METFNFNGDWEYELNLQEFIKSNATWARRIGATNLDRPIKLKILDRKDFDPDPSKEQLATINAICTNEKSVLTSLCKAFETINKHYGDNCGDHDWYSNGMRFDELGKVFLISEIEIFTEHKNGKAYFQLSGGYRGDEEHGLIVVMHEGRLIEYNQIGEDGYAGVYKDLAETSTTFRNFNIEHQNFGEGILHKPSPKYGKFKPWQELAMTEYFELLLKTKNTEKIKEIVKAAAFDINHLWDYREKNLTDLAAHYGNVELLDFLIKAGGDYSNSMVSCNAQNSIAYLVRKGIAIDNSTGYGGTRLYDSIKSYASAIRRGAAPAIKIHEEWIRFYLAMGANPYALTPAGDDYKAVLKPAYFRKELEFQEVVEKIEELIAGNKGVKLNWKF